MASSQSIVDYIAEQLSAAGTITTKKMFGEYGIYCDNKIIGAICNDTLFIKPTKQGLEFCNGNIEMAPAYDGAKPSIVVKDEHLENTEWVTTLITITYEALPKPKPNPKRRPTDKEAR